MMSFEPSFFNNSTFGFSLTILTTSLRVLVVDDTEDMRELLSVILNRQGFEVTCAANGKEMDLALASQPIDLIVLDVMMPDEDGYSICRRLQSPFSPPILMLSARDQDADKVLGLDFGADDYMTKPFSPDELVARIRALHRRAMKKADNRSTENVEHFFGWRLDTKTRRLTSANENFIALSTAEFAVLRVLLDNPDRPLKRELILAKMAEMHERSTPRALDTIISRLRRKLLEVDSEGQEELIQTVYGIGYMLRPAPVAR